MQTAQVETVRALVAAWPVLLQALRALVAVGRPVLQALRELSAVPNRRCRAGLRGLVAMPIVLLDLRCLGMMAAVLEPGGLSPQPLSLLCGNYQSLCGNCQSLSRRDSEI